MMKKGYLIHNKEDKSSSRPYCQSFASITVESSPLTYTPGERHTVNKGLPIAQVFETVPLLNASHINF